jgi:hypothetical protein
VEATVGAGLLELVDELAAAVDLDGADRGGACGDDGQLGR